MSTRVHAKNIHYKGLVLRLQTGEGVSTHPWTMHRTFSLSKLLFHSNLSNEDLTQAFISEYMSITMRHLQEVLNAGSDSKLRSDVVNLRVVLYRCPDLHGPRRLSAAPHSQINIVRARISSINTNRLITPKCWPPKSWLYRFGKCQNR